MNRSLRFVDSSCAEEVNALRTSEYSTAKGFTLDLKSLCWGPSDDQSFVMASFFGDEMVATMRGEIIEDQSLVEKKLECPWTFPMPLNFPILLLSRAATLGSMRGLGLNLVMRYWFLRFAKHHNIAMVLGTFVSDSPREKTLRDMGYQFFENPLGWQQSTYRSHRPVQVVALDMKTSSEGALRYFEAHASEEMKKYKFDDEFSDLRIVRSL